MIRSYRQDGQIRLQTGSWRQFLAEQSTDDLESLIEADRAHQQLSEPTKTTQITAVSPGASDNLTRNHYPPGYTLDDRSRSSKPRDQAR